MTDFNPAPARSAGTKTSPDFTRIAEIETSLGGSRQTFSLPLPSGHSTVIKSWLRAWGVEEEKIAAASEYVLRNAYAAGEPYVRKMLEGDDSGKGKSYYSPRRRRGAPPPNFKLDLNLLGGTNSTNSTKPQEDLDINSIDDDSDPEPVAEDLSSDDWAKEWSILRQQLFSKLDSVLSQKADELNKTNLSQLDANFEAIKTALRDHVANSMKPLVEEILNARVPRDLVLTRPDGSKTSLGSEPRHGIFEKLLRLLSLGEHVYLVGNAGTGKTHLFFQVADALGYDIDSELFMADQSMTKYDTKGFKGPTGDYIPTVVYHAVKSGGLLCIDEIDMWAAPALGALNSILANGYGTFGDELVKVHPRFRCIVAANTYGRGPDRQFIGRNPLDAASLDRFSYLECPYDTDLEHQLFGVNPWVTYVHKVRNAVETLKLNHIVSMRAISRGLKLLNDGFEPEEVCNISLWRGLQKDQILKIQNLAGEFSPPAVATIGTNPLASNSSPTKLDYFKARIVEGHKIEAIRIYRNVADISLYDAKTSVEAIIEFYKTYGGFPTILQNPNWSLPADAPITHTGTF